MAKFGPTGVSFTLESYNSGTNTVGSAEALNDITEFNGINEESVVTDLTTFGDTIKSEGSTGLSQFERITLKGFADDAASGAFRRIGRPARRVDYPSRAFKVTWKSGVTQQIEVFPVQNRLMAELDGITTFEATLAIAASSSSDLSEVGL